MDLLFLGYSYSSKMFNLSKKNRSFSISVDPTKYLLKGSGIGVCLLLSFFLGYLCTFSDSGHGSIGVDPRPLDQVGYGLFVVLSLGASLDPASAARYHHWMLSNAYESNITWVFAGDRVIYL